MAGPTARSATAQEPELAHGVVQVNVLQYSEEELDWQKASEAFKARYAQQ